MRPCACHIGDGRIVDRLGGPGAVADDVDASAVGSYDQILRAIDRRGRAVISRCPELMTGSSVVGDRGMVFLVADVHSGHDDH